MEGHSLAEPERIPLAVKIAYGGAEGASSLAFTVIAIFFLIFLTDVAGIAPSVAGGILFAANIWDAITDPAMGIISDRTRSRYGRRRPYLLGVAVPFGVMFWLLFSVPPLQGSALVLYYLAVSLLMYAAITVLDVPYTALVPEMTQDYDERTNLVGYRVVWSQLASIVGASIPLLIIRRFSDPAGGWSMTGAVFGIGCIFPILLTWRYTRGWERYPEQADALSLPAIFRTVFGNRSFRYIVGVYLFSMAAVYASGSVAMYFLQYRMGFSEGQISVFFLFFFVCTVLWVPVITFASNRIGKRGAFMLFMSLWALTYGVGNFFVQPNHIAAMYLLAGLGSAGACASFQLCWAMIPDVVEVDEFKTGTRREGLYYGMATLVLKTGSAAGLFMVGKSLAWIGYVPNAVQPPASILGLRVMFGPLLAALMVISIVIANFMPMTRDRHKALLEAIEAKRTGRAWSSAGFKELL